MGCYVVNTSQDDDSGKAKCGPALEDYYECLHHKKEVWLVPLAFDALSRKNGSAERRYAGG